jgi:hypothetical protein
MPLRILKARLEAMNITCLEELPKNSNLYFKLRLVVVEKKKMTFIDDAFDLSKTPLPDTVKTAKEAWLAHREDGERYFISVYTK